MSLSKYFKFAFATTGDRASIPDATQPSGEVSFEEGYSIDYQLDPATDPTAKNIERDKANQLYYDITQAIKEYQEFGAPYWIEAAQNGGIAYPYAKYALVRYDIGGGETPIFQSLVDSNTDLPTVTASWQRLASANPFIVDNATFEASVANGEIVYWDNVNNRFDEAIADGTTAQNAVGMADVTNAKVYLFGAIPAGVISGLTANVAYYLSTVTPGAITSVRPSTNAVQVGTSKSATTFFLNINAAQPLATETIAGLAELATDAEAQAFAANKFIDGAKLAAAFKGANQSLAASGYQKLPGGLIIQWGRTGAIASTASLTVNYNVTFPTAVFAVIAGRTGDAGAVSTGASISAIPSSNSQFAIRNSTADASATPFWIALGK